MTRLLVNGRFLAQEVTGVQRFALEMARALAGLGTVEVLGPPDARDAAGLAVRRVGRRRGQAWEQFDLPRHAGGGVLVNLGNSAPLALGRQVVVIHDAATVAYPASYGWRFRTWYRWMQRGLAWRGARLATVSGFSRAAIARHLGVDAGGIAVVGEGAEHVLRVAADGGLRARLGLEGRYVLAVGSLARHKNLAALGATARMLAARGETLVLTGAADPRLFAAAALPEPARLVGRVDDAGLRALYEGASCFVFPSLHEGFGLPAVEAMACGCPVVAARAGALPEVCGEAALLVDPHDPAAIAAAVARVLDEPGLAGRLRAAGRARAAAFTWEDAARRLAAVAGEMAA
jgi:glycosyltransferase involved in cell wall biosynthesis